MERCVNERRCPLGRNQSLAGPVTRYTYSGDREKAVRGDTKGRETAGGECDITGHRPGIAIVNIHRRMNRVCGRSMYAGLRGAHCLWTSRVVRVSAIRGYAENDGNLMLVQIGGR